MILSCRRFFPHSLRFVFCVRGAIARSTVVKIFRYPNNRVLKVKQFRRRNRPAGGGPFMNGDYRLGLRKSGRANSGSDQS